MASRKDLKKQINNICGELFADCVALKMCEQGNDEQLNEVMLEIWDLRREYVSRISHTDKLSERVSYKKLRAEFSEKAEALSKKIISC